MTRTFAKAAENSVLDSVDIPGKSSAGSIPRKQIPSKPKKPSKKPKERKEASTKLNEDLLFNLHEFITVIGASTYPVISMLYPLSNSNI